MRRSKLASLVFAAFLALGVVACNDDVEEPVDEETPEEEETPEAEETPEEEETPED
jgi:hypothetical protein